MRGGEHYMRYFNALVRIKPKQPNIQRSTAGRELIAVLREGLNSRKYGFELRSIVEKQNKKKSTAGG